MTSCAEAARRSACHLKQNWTRLCSRVDSIRRGRPLEVGLSAHFWCIWHEIIPCSQSPLRPKSWPNSASAMGIWSSWRMVVATTHTWWRKLSNPASARFRRIRRTVRSSREAERSDQRRSLIGTGASRQGPVWRAGGHLAGSLNGNKRPSTIFSRRRGSAFEMIVLHSTTLFF
jgi:hypothetical protein